MLASAKNGFAVVVMAVVRRVRDASVLLNAIVDTWFICCG